MLFPVPRSRIAVRSVAGPFSNYLGAEETAILIALVAEVAPRVMIEFGCNVGRTAKRVLENVPSIEKYIGIDVPTGHVPILPCQLSEIPLWPASEAVRDPRFELLLRDSSQLDEVEPCDAAFIDADHSVGAVLYESNLAHAAMRPGGIIVWHDYNNSAVEVTAALDHLHDAEGWPIYSVLGTWLAFMKFTRATP
jgi:predicted O-methyltransferase YrrM